MKASAALGTLATAMIASQSNRNTASAFAPVPNTQKTMNLTPSKNNNSAKLIGAAPSMSEASQKSSTALAAISGAELQAAATVAGHAALGLGATLGAFKISERIDAATDNPIARTAGEALAAVPIILTMNLLQQDLSQLQAVSDPLVKYMDAWEAQEALTQAADVAKTTLNLN